MKSIALFILMLVATNLVAQTSDDQFQRPMVDVINDLQQKYDVRIKYNVQDFANYDLIYADWRLVPGDLEASLKNVLAPFDYIFVKQGEHTYKIKPFQYHLVTPERGAERLEYLKTLYSDKSSWEERRSELRKCIREAVGIDDLPSTPNPTIIFSNKRKYDGYTIENVALETVPGLFVTGSIYKPSRIKGSAPVILSPNGHFGDGRYNKDIQIRCAALAKMGAIVVNYDLFGWGESAMQVGSTSHRMSLAHTIQANNSIKLLDYLLTIKGADANRVGITGGSGGGSMTMLISAIDDRIKVSVPVVMTSSFHSGGCPCESGTPIHLCGEQTNNAEIAAIFAPKPQLVVSDGGDWTFQVPEVEYPFIKRTYGFYDASDKVENAHLAREKHDYGFSKRKPMYEFMAKNLNLDLSKIKDASGKIDDSDITVEDEEKMYVFGNDPNQLPEGSVLHIDELVEKLNK
ncbi:MAG: acetylxylan esterase [Cyclobacteriaceae bacterium]